MAKEELAKELILNTDGDGDGETLTESDIATLHAGLAIPVGVVVMLAIGIPSGYFECNGQEISRTTYSNLFNVIGTTYGVGNGTTTFNVPTISSTATVYFGGIKFAIKS